MWSGYTVWLNSCSFNYICIICINSFFLSLRYWLNSCQSAFLILYLTAVDKGFIILFSAAMISNLLISWSESVAASELIAQFWAFLWFENVKLIIDLNTEL